MEKLFNQGQYTESHLTGNTYFILGAHWNEDKQDWYYNLWIENFKNPESFLADIPNAKRKYVTFTGRGGYYVTSEAVQKLWLIDKVL